MFVCLMVARLVPISSRASRRQAYARAVGVLLPEAAAGGRPARHVAREIMDLLASVLPRLKLDAEKDELFLRGMLACASGARELGRLRAAAADASLPDSARTVLDTEVACLGAVLSRLPRVREGREACLEQGRDAIRRMGTTLERLTPAAGSPEARTILRAASSLRFLADRFERDRAFLHLALTE